HSGGSIVEIGSHDELMRIQDGRYRMLVEAQNRSQDAEKEQATGDLKLIKPDSIMSDLQRSGSFSRQSSSKVSVHEKEEPSKPARKGPASGDDDEGDDPSLPPVSMLRIWKLSAPEWKFLVLGAIGAILNASVFPIWGVLLTKVTVLFFRMDLTKSEMLHDARYWSLGFICLGVAFGLSITMQHYGFAVASQKLVSRVRLATFSAMIRQEVGWFDLDENSSGALVSRLATDSATLQAMTSDTLNQGLVNLTTLGIGFGIAFYFSWQMTLALLGTSPILMFSSYVQAQQMSGTNNSKKNNDADTAAGSILSEAIGSIRTVASFSMEKALNTVYVGYLDASRQADTKVGIIGGAAFGFSMSVMFLNQAFLFWLGGIWVSKGTITFEDMFMVILVIMLSTFAVGMAAQNMTDSAKAKKAASRVFKIIDRVPAIDA
ncbi:Multidrug resistance protein abc superfamily, partial [Globisporangium polare]